MMWFRFLFIAFLGDLVTASPVFVTKLSNAQVDRLASWSETDRQNIWELSGQSEGDMVLLPGQRNGLISTKYRWFNNEIPYEIADGYFDDVQVAWIHESLQEFEHISCIRARPRGSQDVDYVRITGADSGCWSYVGRVGGRQDLNLQSFAPGEGCFRNGTIVHEFLHALGFYHQQSASERDDFVDIIWENIQSGTENNFVKYSSNEITSFGEIYDYASVMHYGAFAFSDNGDATIVPKDPDAEIGQRIGLSEIDIKKLNLMYEC